MLLPDENSFCTRVVGILPARRRKPRASQRRCAIEVPRPIDTGVGRGQEAHGAGMAGALLAEGGFRLGQGYPAGPMSAVIEAAPV